MAKDIPEEISSTQRELSRRRFLRNAGAVASLPLLGGVAGILGSEGAGAQVYNRHSDHPFFAAHPKYHFVMDNHVTTNSFFTATIYGCEDFCALTGCTFTWTGSQTSVVGQMVSAMQERDRFEGEWHRRADHRQHGFQRSDERGAQRRHSRHCLQRGRVTRLRQQQDGLRRPVEPDGRRRGSDVDPGSRCAAPEQG